MHISWASTTASIATDNMTRLHVQSLVLRLSLVLMVVFEFCVGFDVCNNLIQVEHDLDGANQVVACRYQILKWDQAGVFIREMVRTPVNRTLCHDLRTADTCHPDGSLVTCHHVPEWERHPEGTFLPPKGCAFSQNVQCQLETICPSETDIATTKSTESEMSTIKPVSKLPSLTAKVRVSKDNQVTVTDETTPVTTIGSTPEQEEITQHIIIHVRRPAPENKHSAATSSALSSLTLALSFVFSIIFMNCYFKTHLI
uniref:Uncharacterized protein LOC111137557 n=1 Tax=Crassostrea virginica TaxID=6565 RepID=A0A8B8EXL6_CRAVI|nr:uncharacterized protein LOC111137557 [Crassostrea virginica]XP_022344761.1 uncharacterized protein LOC111137557 [Crassostrea virginica]XP_022344762.1 uncharacterized protein LOC111137557 [Crassostrea virginica]